MSASGIARAPIVAASCSARSNVRFATTTSSDAARPQRGREPGAHLARADHEHARAVEVAEVLGRDRDRGRRDRHRVAGDPGLGAHPLARLDRVLEHAREQLGRGLLADRRLPRVADLAEDLALADDHRVETGRDREQVRDRGFVVVRVEVVGELVGIGARVRGEEVAYVADRGVEVRAARVDLGAVARRQQHDLEQVLARGEIVQRLREPSSGTVMRSRSSTGTVRWFRPTTRRDTSSTTPLPRRSDPCARVPRCRRRTRIASRRPRIERPVARNASRASERRSSRVSYSGPISSSSRRRR